MDDTNLPISPLSTTVYEDTIINEANMNQLISNAQFINTPGSVSYSSRRFYYAMGYGATDGGDDYTKGIGGGNYLFVNIAKGWWGTTLWN